MKKSALSLLMVAAMISATACATSETEDNSSELQSTTSQQEISSTEASIDTSQTASVSASEAPADYHAVWNPDITLRQKLKEDGYLCAVAFIASVEPETTREQCVEMFYNSQYSKDYPTITDIPKENCIDDCSGYELYLVIPANENATVSVNEWLLTEENDYMGESGQVYYRSETGAPLLIKCNVSDIMSNVVVNIVDNDGNSMQWLPGLSLKDGSVSLYGAENKIYDITHYIFNETNESYRIEE